MCVLSSSPRLFALLLLGATAVQGGEAPSFRNDVMAAVSKAGCNLGSCHGNATGKGGFKLSLRGQDLDYDFTALSRDVSGRRVNLFAPDESLLLVKATNKLAHEGGKRMDDRSWEYQVLREWIAAGMPAAAKDEARVKKLEVSPAGLILDEAQDQVQLSAKVTFSDGSQRDVTSQVVYEPLQNGLVEVSRDGLVKRLEFGEPTVLVRFLDQSVPVRLTFLRASPDFVWARPRRDNYVDAHVFTKLKTLRMNPSAVCSDDVFVRRAHLDLLGMVPSAEEARAFVTDKAPAKRARLVDRLLVRQEFADFWALKWADVLKVESRTLDVTGMKAFHGWLRDGIAQNRPMDVLVREMVASRGSTYQDAPSNFYRANRTPAARAVAAAQVFMGTRLQCAECHNHPFDRWTQDDYYNWSAVFGQVDYKIIGDNKRRDKNDKHEFNGEQVVFMNPKLSVQNPRTGEKARARFLGADMPKLGEHEDELQAASVWLTSDKNPLFAKSQVNRIWYYLMGRGLVDPVDDFRLTNPASHPELLEDLTRDFVKSGFDLRHIIRTIMLSRSYQLDSAPNATNAADEINYSHNLPRRLSAEQLFDSLYVAMRVRPELKDNAGLRAGQLAGPMNGRGSPDPLSPEAFLVQFGRPKRELSCECERASDTNIGQIFQFISGPIVGQVMGDEKNRLATLAKNKNAAEVVGDLYWALLTRAPTGDEAKVMESLVVSSTNKRAALEDIAWSLVNAKEFVLRR